MSDDDDGITMGVKECRPVGKYGASCCGRSNIVVFFNYMTF